MERVHKPQDARSCRSQRQCRMFSFRSHDASVLIEAKREAMSHKTCSRQAGVSNQAPESFERLAAALLPWSTDGSLGLCSWKMRKTVRLSLKTYWKESAKFGQERKHRSRKESDIISYFWSSAMRHLHRISLGLHLLYQRTAPSRQLLDRYSSPSFPE
jgi:hypothetical protein